MSVDPMVRVFQLDAEKFKAERAELRRHAEALARALRTMYEVHNQSGGSGTEEDWQFWLGECAGANHVAHSVLAAWDAYNQEGQTDG